MIKGMEGVLKANYRETRSPKRRGESDFHTALLSGIEEERAASQELERVQDFFLMNMWKNKSSIERKKYDELLEALGRQAVKAAED